MIREVRERRLGYRSVSRSLVYITVVELQCFSMQLNSEIKAKFPGTDPKLEHHQHSPNPSSPPPITGQICTDSKAPTQPPSSPRKTLQENSNHKSVRNFNGTTQTQLSLRKPFHHSTENSPACIESTTPSILALSIPLRRQRRPLVNR